MRSETPFGRGMRLLAAGCYADGWPLYEARRQFMTPPPPTPIAAQPEWTGEPLQGRRIVVCAEQGWGDQLMFGRYLAQLRDQGAEVVVACHPFVIGRFFASLGYVVSPFFVDRPVYGGDYWTLIGSLPLRLGAGAPALPAYRPIDVPREGGVGIVTRGSPTHWNDANRSLPPAVAEQLLALGQDLSPEATGAHDLLHTAELMARLDLIITVDTAAAHLAGSIGKDCWVLLPYSGLDWRWGDGVRSDWYPGMRLFRQPAPGDWDAVLDAVVAALAERLPH